MTMMEQGPPHLHDDTTGRSEVMAVTIVPQVGGQQSGGFTHASQDTLDPRTQVREGPCFVIPSTMATSGTTSKADRSRH